MRKILLVAVAILFFNVSNFGQSPYEETAKIKERLNLPFKTVITFDDSASLPGNREIKVFVGTDNNKKAAKRFTKWINKWNKKDAKDFGKMTLVDYITEADVILARFKVREFQPQQQTSVEIGSKINTPTIRQSSKPIIRSEVYVPRPQYSYLIIRKEDSLGIAYKDIDKSNRRDHSNPDKYLFNEFKKRMKNR